MNAEILISLIKRFEEFEQKEPLGDIFAFGLWLYKQGNPSSRSETNSQSDRMTGYYLNRMNKYSRFYTRKSFEGLPISTLDEFTLLNIIGRLNNPSKNEAYIEAIIEITSGAVMMKRLIKLGLVKEITDKTDRRVKRVLLTEKGKNIQQLCFNRLSPELHLKLGNLSEEDKSQLLTILTKLDKFHFGIWKNDSQLGIDELITKYVL